MTFPSSSTSPQSRLPPELLTIPTTKGSTPRLSTSQNSYNYQAYGSSCFGYPYSQATPQLTQPFWQQHLEWTLENEHQHNNQFYQPHESYAMDFNTVLIGSNTKNGRILPQESMSANKNNFMPRPKVDVYVDGDFVKQMPLGTLVRFSKVAAAAFPKPETSADDADKALATTHDGAEAKDEEVDVKKLTADMAKLGGHGSNPAITNQVQYLSTTSSAGPSVKRLNLHLESLWYQPLPQSINFALMWMEQARTARHGETPLVYGVPQPDALSLQNLVDTYAAALCLDLRPFPHKHRHDIMTHVTNVRPLVLHIQYIHEHLPVDDPVMTRAITSFFQHQATHSYAEGEAEAIEDYAYSTNDDQLLKRFADIQKDRDEKAKSRNRRRGAARMQSFAEDLDGNSKEEHVQRVAAAGPTTSGPNPNDADKEGGGRRQSGRKQQQKGKGVNGRDVPGA